MAHLRTQKPRPSSQERLQWKLHLVEWLHEQGYSEDMFVDLFRFLDLVMVLGPKLEEQFEVTLAEYEEEWQMPFLCNRERRAMDRGHEQAAREALIDVLDVRFGETPPHIEEQLRELDDPSVLRRLLRRAASVESLEEFERELPSAVGMR